MECGKLTAKLRDAVPVCFMVDGKEIKRYKNIEIPDELKKLPFADFKFDVPASGAITFKIHFEPGILPDEWPQARERKSRKAKPMAEEIKEPEAMIAEPIQEEVGINEAETMPQESEPVGVEVKPRMLENMVRAYNASGDRRKALVQAIGEYCGETPKYQNAPTFAYVIGDYTVDKNGTVTGPHDAELLEALEAKGFISN